MKKLTNIFPLDLPHGHQLSCQILARMIAGIALRTPRAFCRNTGMHEQRQLNVTIEKMETGGLYKPRVYTIIHQANMASCFFIHHPTPEVRCCGGPFTLPAVTRIHQLQPARGVPVVAQECMEAVNLLAQLIEAVIHLEHTRI